jgi:hypothetical protein
MQAIVGACLAGLGALTLVVIVRSREVRDRDFPLIAAAVGGAFAVAYGGVNETRLWGVSAASYAFLAYLVTAMQWVKRSPRSPAPAPMRLALLAATFAWCTAVDIVSGLDPGKHLLAYLVIGCAIAASALLVAHGGVDTASAARAGLVVVGLSDILGLRAAEPWRACDKFKCSSLGGLFRGPFPSENALALIAVMTLAWTLTATRGRTRTLGTALCAATVFATGSRTGLAVSALAIGAVLLSRRSARWTARGSWTPSWPLATALAATTATAGLYIVYRAGANAFSDRGEIWALALKMVHGHQITGVGLSTYGVLQQQGLVSQHFTHSEYLLVLFAGGYVAIALFVAWGAVTIRSLAQLADSPTAAVPVLAFLAYGLTEATWNPLAFDAFAWIALALAVTVPGPTYGVAETDETRNERFSTRAARAATVGAPA